MNYAKLMEANWAMLASSDEGRQALAESLPPEERRLIERAAGPGLEIELARRRKAISSVLFSGYPTTYFAFLAFEGKQGVMKFLESTEWRERPAQPGSAFPPVATTTKAFSRYLTETRWAERQERWIAEAFAFEDTVLFGGAASRPSRVAGLAESAWVAEASYDVPACALLMRRRGQEDPWYDAIHFVKPDPFPLAMVSVPDGGRIRRIRLSGEVLEGLSWLWDARREMPEGALESGIFKNAVKAGIARVL